MSSFKGRFCEIFKKEADVRLIVVMLGIKYHPVAEKKKIMSNSFIDLVCMQILVAPY